MGKTNEKILICLYVGICVSSIITTHILTRENPIRLYNKERFNYLPEEQICVAKGIELGKKLKVDLPVMRETGPLPNGTFIAAYIKEKKGFFGYLRTLCIYDISDQIAEFENENSAYRHLTKAFKSKLAIYKHWQFNPLDYKKWKEPLAQDIWVQKLARSKYRELYKEQKGIAYKTKNEQRYILFTNKKAYVLEIISNHASDAIKEELTGISTLDLEGYGKRIVYKLLLCLFICCIMIVAFVYYSIKPYRQNPIRNSQAAKLLKFVSCMTALNAAIALLSVICIYICNDSQIIYYGNNYIDMEIIAYIAISTIVLLDLPICTSLYIKSKRGYAYDYLIQDKCRVYFNNRLDNIQEKKALVSLLYYPLYIIGGLPFGIFCIFYVVPFSSFLLVCIELRHLYRWINKDAVTKAASEKNLFIDYYVVLDLRKDADIITIERAFNSAISKYNSANGNPLYGKQFYKKIQEAYAVLGSTNQLRPEYDIEYDSYKASNSTTYCFINKQLESEIVDIRNTLSGYKKDYGSKLPKVNVVIFSLLLLLLTTFAILRLVEVIPPLWESRNHYNTNKFYEGSGIGKGPGIRKGPPSSPGPSLDEGPSYW